MVGSVLTRPSESKEQGHPRFENRKEKAEGRPPATLFPILSPRRSALVLTTLLLRRPISIRRILPVHVPGSTPFGFGRVARPLILLTPAILWVPVLAFFGGWPRLLICWHRQQSGCPVLRVPCEGRVPRTPAAAQLRHSSRERNLRPSLIHPYRPRLVEKVETITAPSPLLRRPDQTSLHRVAMHVPQLLHALLRGPYVEVIGARLPERSALRLVSKQIGRVAQPLISLTPAILWVPRPCILCKGGSLNCLRNGLRLRCRCAKRNLGPAVIHSHRPGFVQQIKTITAPAPLARASDKVQVIGAVATMQAARHETEW